MGEGRSGVHGIKQAVFAGGNLNEGLDVLRTSAATTDVFESELSFDLAWHHNARARRISDIRIGDSLAQA
jgi:hypothetical protein